MKKMAGNRKIELVRLSIVMTVLFTTFVFGQDGNALRPVSGADGIFEAVRIGNNSVYRTIASGGHYQYYMYFQCDQQVRNRTVYLEVQYLDVGFGYIRLEYNSMFSNYDSNAEGYQNYVQDSQLIRTAVFKLRQADFRNAQNLATDLRLSTDGSIQMHILSVRWYPDPTPTFLKYDEDWMTPYAGPKETTENRVNATTLLGKVICGYQGWFRTAGDPSGAGWVHYVAGNFNRVTVDLWPDMLEYSSEEKYPVPGWTYGDGSQVFLFSSANKNTVLRHFQWMKAYGIDGVAVQRFGAGVNKQHYKESFRIIGYSSEAANRTGRTYCIMYDLTGMDPTNMVDLIADDWRFLVDSLKITTDERYLYHQGKPVVGLFGFFADRFDAKYANQMLDLFQNAGPYQAFVAGSGQWPWRTETKSGWLNVFKRMDAYIPWNIGNYDGKYSATNQWLPDKSVLDAAGKMYMPLIYPGFCWDNLMNQTPGTSYKARLKGEFMWRQFLDAKRIGSQAVYIAMFDEIDEGTAIFKVTNDTPVNHYFADYEGMPSDFYLLLTGYGTKMMRSEVGIPAAMPDFADQSQPSVPEILSPAYGKIVQNSLLISWTAARHVTGIEFYELQLDQSPIIQVADTFKVISLSVGNHMARVRAGNHLHNKGGWSETIVFTVTDKYNITFSVSVPTSTPSTDIIYLTGNFNNWSAGPGPTGVTMEKTGPFDWSITIPFSPGTAIEYKYTHGDWSKVEKDSLGGEVNNRKFVTTASQSTVQDMVRRWADIPVSVSDQRLLPIQYQLQQNYPNPFNPATLIRYTLPNDEQVRLEVFDAMGRQVAVLVNGKKSAGVHETVLQATNLAGGVYFYRLIAGEFVAKRKMLLIR
jgi:hypothetical protein